MSAQILKFQAGNTPGAADHKNREQTVYVVDDDPAVRHALGMLLESMGYAVRMYGSADDLLGAVHDAPQGVLLLDQRMSGKSGLELQAELTAQGIQWPIIFISGHGSVDISVRAMKAGAIDFLEKPFKNINLLKVIRTAFLQTTTEEDRMRTDAIERRCAQLTPREREVMQLVTKGLSNNSIAGSLGVSIRTVEVHRSRVMSKMDADSLPNLVRMVDVCKLCAD